MKIYTYVCIVFSFYIQNTSSGISALRRIPQQGLLRNAMRPQSRSFFPGFHGDDVGVGFVVREEIPYLKSPEIPSIASVENKTQQVSPKNYMKKILEKSTWKDLVAAQNPEKRILQNLLKDEGNSTIGNSVQSVTPSNAPLYLAAGTNAGVIGGATAYYINQNMDQKEPQELAAIPSDEADQGIQEESTTAHEKNVEVANQELENSVVKPSVASSVTLLDRFKNTMYTGFGYIKYPFVSTYGMLKNASYASYEKFNQLMARWLGLQRLNAQIQQGAK